MPANFPWDQLINVLFFLLGFGLGLFQLWQAQKYYLADQQNKYKEISDAVTTISQRLAVIEGVTNRLVDIDKTLATLGAASDAFQGRMFGIVERQILASERATQEASAEIRATIANELGNLGLTSESLKKIDTKIDEVLDNMTDAVATASQEQVADVSLVRQVVGTSLATEWNVEADDFDLDISKDEVIKVGDIEIDTRTSLVRIRGKEIQLHKREYIILLLLLKNVNRPVPGRVIAQVLYDGKALPAEGVMGDIYRQWFRLKRVVDTDTPTLMGSYATGYYVFDPER